MTTKEVQARKEDKITIGESEGATISVESGDAPEEERTRGGILLSLQKIEGQTGRLVKLTTKLLKRSEKAPETVVAVKEPRPFAAPKKSEKPALIQAEKSSTQRALPPRDEKGRFARIQPAGMKKSPAEIVARIPPAKTAPSVSGLKPSARIRAKKAGWVERRETQHDKLARSEKQKAAVISSPRSGDKLREKSLAKPSERVVKAEQVKKTKPAQAAREAKQPLDSRRSLSSLRGGGNDKRIKAEKTPEAKTAPAKPKPARARKQPAARPDAPSPSAGTRDAKGRFVGKSKSVEKQEARKKEQDNRTFLDKMVEAVKDPFGTMGKIGDALEADKSDVTDEVGSATMGTAYDIGKELVEAADDPVVKKAIGFMKSLKKKGKVGEEEKEEAKPDKQPEARAKKEAAPEPSPQPSVISRSPRSGDKLREEKSLAKPSERRVKDDLTGKPKPAQAAGKAAQVRTGQMVDAVKAVESALEETEKAQEKRDAKAEKAEARRHKETRQAVAQSGQGEQEGLLDTVADFIPGRKKKGGLLGKAGGFLGKAGGMVGKGLGFAGRAAGKLALPLAGAMGAYDAYKGWNNAAEITGKDPEKVTTGDKIKASLAKAAEGLTFGLLSTDTFFGKSKKQKEREAVEAEKKSKEKAVMSKATRLADALLGKPAAPEAVKKEVAPDPEPQPSVAKVEKTAVISRRDSDEKSLAKIADISGSPSQPLRDRKPAETPKSSLRQKLGAVLGLGSKKPAAKEAEAAPLKPKHVAAAVRDSSSPLLEDRAGGKPGKEETLAQDAARSVVSRPASASFLPSPLRQSSRKTKAGRKTPAQAQTTPPARGKLDVQGVPELLRAVRQLSRKLDRLAASDGPNPIHDPLLKETIDEADKAFGTWT